MQVNPNGMVVDQDDDQDSLFGSPPSSPVRGRSPSPALALPSASNSTQNVGTIALPGSHHYSELPVTPLALSLSYALNELTSRPPAPPSNAISSNSATPVSSSRASSTGPSIRPKKKTKKTQTKESTPRPPPPEILLPDPSGPVPANFLRNQSALLGTAGLVGGVKPANLSTNRYSRGTVPSNPIVIDDEDPIPGVHRLSQFRVHPNSKHKEIDPNLLPTPSTQEVVAVLIGQKDIFPVLESVLKLLAEGGGPQALNPPPADPPSFFRRTPQSFQSFDSAGTTTQGSTIGASIGPPTKKRRLNRVPAGAVDWDVPYPFPEGHGPASYRSTWQRERGKQLISQLVALIKSAARKAATRKYLESEKAKKRQLESQRAYERARQAALGKAVEEEPKVLGHYRPSTATYGLQGEAPAATKTQASDVLTDASNVTKKITLTPTPSCSLPRQPVQSSTSLSSSMNATPTPSIPSSSSTPFDQLISSLLAATPNQNTSSNKRPSVPDNISSPEDSGSRSATSTPVPSPASESPDQGLLDNWMNILQTFPMPASDSSTLTHDMWGLPPQSDTSSKDDSNFFDLDQTWADPNSVDPASYDFGSIFDTEMSSLPVEAPSQPGTNDAPGFSPQDIAIDPTLLAISIPNLSGAPTTKTLETTPSLTGSPRASLSSLGDIDPMTPNSASWQLAYPDVFPEGEASTPTNESAGCAGGLAGQVDVEEYLNSLIATQEQCKSVDALSLDKGKARDQSNLVAAPPLLLPTAPRSQFADLSISSSTSMQVSSQQPTQIAPSAVLLPRSRSSQSSKADILKRANERKKLLMKEIDKARTQLWETTIEQGVLSHMNKLCSHTT